MSGGSPNRFNPQPWPSAAPPPVPGNWRPPGAHAPPPAPPPYSSEPSRVHPSPNLNPLFPRPNFQNAQGQGFLEPWLPTWERTMIGPLGFAGFPVPSLSPFAFLLFDEMTRYPPIPTPRGPLPEFGDESRLSQEEQKQALKMLKKEIYNPRATAKRLAKSLSLYYRRNNSGGARNSSFTEDDEEDEDDDDDDGKRCAVCLDDFAPKQVVMLTPCNHMFHEDCIVPWVKSRAQCPVCRFVIYQPTRALNNYNNINNAPLRRPATDEAVGGELPSVIRALEDAFVWGVRTHR